MKEGFLTESMEKFPEEFLQGFMMQEISKGIHGRILEFGGIP